MSNAPRLLESWKFAVLALGSGVTLSTVGEDVVEPVTAGKVTVIVPVDTPADEVTAQLAPHPVGFNGTAAAPRAVNNASPRGNTPAVGNDVFAAFNSGG